MKTTIQGSTLASHLKPQNLKVLWHEGVDYDKITLAIEECNGKKYLNSFVEQPTCKISMHLNLDGTDSVSESDASVGMEPIASATEVCGPDECFTMKWSDLSNVNRNVGIHPGAYQFDVDGLTVNTGITHIKMPCTHVTSPLVIRHPQKDTEPVSDGAYKPMGCIDALKLSACLNAAIRISSLTARRGELRAQAIHLGIKGNLFNVEAISSNGAVICPIETDRNSLPQGKEEIHVAINLYAARALKLISDLSGETIWWTYDDSNDTITLSSSHYTIEIVSEEVAVCRIPYECPDDYHELSMACKDLYVAARKTRVAGYGTIVIGSDKEGILYAGSPDDKVKSSIGMKMKDGYCQVSPVTLPVDTLLAIIGAYSAENLTLTIGTGNYINLISDDEITGLVFLV